MNAVDKYIQLAEAWVVSIEDGDSDTANSLYDRIHELFQEIRRSGQEEALFNRADTVDDAACFFIASHIKENNQRRAIMLYERLTRSPQPFVAMSAKTIVSEAAGHGT